ncbi:hypothetical protein [Phormidesmis sp. 146-33]
MQFTSLSKAVRALGSIAVLSVMVGTLVQPVQAQGKVPSTENSVCVPLPEGVFYQEFGGITFSPAQKAAYRKIEAKMKERFAALSATLKTVEDPNRSVSIAINKPMGEQVYAEYDAMVTALGSAQVPGDEQVKLINQKFGKYVEASISQVAADTPEQIAEGQQIGLDFEAQTMAILTPEQRPIYQANLAIQRQIQACTAPSPFARIISPLPY